MPRPRSVENRQRVVDTAAMLFCERGYVNTTTQDIADVLGIRKGSLYHYITTKEDLLVEVADEARVMWATHLTMSRRATGTPEQRLVRFMHEHLELFLSHRHQATVLQSEFQHFPADVSVELAVLTRAYRGFVADLVVEGQQHGRLRRELDPQMSATILIEMLNSAGRWFEPTGTSSTAQVVDTCLAIAFEGFAALAPVA